MVMSLNGARSQAVKKVIQPIKKALDADYFSYCSYKKGECEFVSSNFSEIREFVDDIGTHMPVDTTEQTAVLEWEQFSSREYLDKVHKRHFLSSKGVTFVLRHSPTEAEHISLNTYNHEINMMNALRGQPMLMKDIIKHIRNQVNYNKKLFDALSFKKELTNNNKAIIKEPTLAISGCNREYVHGLNGPTYITRAEKKCLLLLLQLKVSKEIARDIGITPRTVESHVANLKAKLGVKRRHEFFVVARNNFILPG